MVHLPHNRTIDQPTSSNGTYDPKGKKTKTNQKLSFLFFLGISSILALAACYHVGFMLDNIIYEKSIGWTQTSAPRSRGARRITDRSLLPYDCGMVFFYHVPSTGGATITSWLKKYSSISSLHATGGIRVAPEGTFSFFDHWGRLEDGSGDHRIPEHFINGTKRSVGMNTFVTNFAWDEWRIAHCHHSSMHLNISENLLTQWRSTVELQGCAFIAAIMFRDPLSHTLSLFKHISRYKSSREVWTKHLYTKSEMGQWQTQLDYFLYNILDRNPDGVDKETKIQRGLELLERHFDIVTVGEHDRFRRELLEMTGWEEKEMKRENSHPRDFMFSKREIEEMQKLIEDNGDTDFIYQVKSRYKNDGTRDG